MSNVFSLQERRELLALKKQLDELQTQIEGMEQSTASLKMRLTPGLAKQVAMLVFSEQLLRYRDQWERLRPQFAAMFEMVFAMQRAEGKELDWEQAAALIFGDNGFITELNKRIDARVEKLPRDAARFKRELDALCAQATEPERPALTLVSTEGDTEP
jgi:hypothetical protein